MLENHPPSILSVRMTPHDRALLETAAEQSRTSLSDFVRRKALEAAEIDLLERRYLSIPSSDWAKVESWVKTPAKTNARLKKLAKSRPAWQT